MATPAYVEDLQQPSQAQGGSVNVATASPATPQFLSEVQASPGSAAQVSVPTPQTVQATPTISSNATQKSAILATATQVSSSQTQYVTAEIQSPGIQASNGQSTPQYIVVTVTEGSLHSNDSVSDSSPPPSVVQTSVPTQVVQQVQTAQLQVQASVEQQRCELEADRERRAGRWSAEDTGTAKRAWTASRHTQHWLAAAAAAGDWAFRPAAEPSRFPPFVPVSLAYPVPFPVSGALLAAEGWEAERPVAVRTQTQTLPPVLLCESATALRVQQQIQQGSVPHVYSSQVQYVEGREANYSGTIRSGSYPYSESSLYSQATPTGSYYETTPSTAAQIVTNSSSGAGSGVTVVTAGSAGSSGGAGAEGSGGGTGSYVIQGGYMLGGGSNSNQGYTHTTRASPATVEWLLDNYETAEGVSLPRCTLYCHYLLHCQEAKLEPVNAASFGKLIRSVFMGLRTRRLGTRGNSKYHYYGLRIKAGSPLLRLIEDQQHLAMRQQPFSHKQRIKPVQKVEGMTNGMSLGGQQQGGGLSDISAQVQQYQQFLDATRTLPDFPVIELQAKVLANGISVENIAAYQQLYREHCEAILDVMVNLQFPLVETLWKSFWRFNESQTSEASDAASVNEESEKRLPKSALVLLCKYEPVLNWSRDCDNILYQSLVEVLIPDVLRPIPSALTQAIRNFGKSVESWLTSAMMNIPEEMVRIKVTCVGAFAQTLRRYTSLNHLAQAARAVLQNTTQINQMLSDLNRVDFANVQEQASWVCRCEDGVVQRLEQDFKLTLQQQNSLEQWAAWLDGVVSQVLKPYQSSPAFPKAAKQFLLKWSFYSSMVIRDLTLRSAASFGSFHLIRLLYDEYMYYLIEHRVAQAKGETPIAVMGEFSTLSRSLSTLDPDKEEEEEEDESDEECQELTAHAADSSLALEPPAKLARTDSSVL
ncbi:MHC class II regulatory factor RFX1 isoform X1 [Sardina pilchardus]|uniref:MHC class II regulatory factor RFX1 isoform X1 n=1 Tax=Sardina pilchardus TaxID=27697 RepID=UPI002E0E892C